MADWNLDDIPPDWVELLTGLKPGEGLVLTKDGEPVARLTHTGPVQWPCQAGSARDTEHFMAPDFDAPLDDFREYME